MGRQEDKELMMNRHKPLTLLIAEMQSMVLSLLHYLEPKGSALKTAH